MHFRLRQILQIAPRTGCMVHNLASKWESPKPFAGVCSVITSSQRPALTFLFPLSYPDFYFPSEHLILPEINFCSFLFVCLSH